MVSLCQRTPSKIGRRLAQMVSERRAWPCSARLVVRPHIARLTWLVQARAGKVRMGEGMGAEGTARPRVRCPQSRALHVW